MGTELRSDRRALIRTASARVLADAGQLEAAERAGRRATESGSATAWHVLGDVLSRQGRIAEGLTAYAEAIRAGCYPPHAHRSLALALDLIGRTTDADSVVNQWAQHHPADPVAAHMLAARAGRESPDRASDAYLQAEFGGFASGFDETMARLDYAAPDLVHDALADALDGVVVGRLLDIGCGTGLCGAAVRDLTGGWMRTALDDSRRDTSSVIWAASSARCTRGRAR